MSAAQIPWRKTESGQEITTLVLIVALVAAIFLGSWLLVVNCKPVRQTLEGMPRVQGIVDNTVTVQVRGQDALIFEPADFSPYSIPATFAIVPPVRLERNERFAIYDNGPKLSVIVNGEERNVSGESRLYYLGTAGFSMEIGWNYPHVIPELERQLEVEKDSHAQR